MRTFSSNPSLSDTRNLWKNCLLQLGQVQLLTWNQPFSVSAKFYSIYRQSIFFMLVLNFTALLIFALSRSHNIWEQFSQNYLSFENITAFFLKRHRRHWLHKTLVHETWSRNKMYLVRNFGDISVVQKSPLKCEGFWFVPMHFPKCKGKKDALLPNGFKQYSGFFYLNDWYGLKKTF